MSDTNRPPSPWSDPDPGPADLIEERQVPARLGELEALVEDWLTDHTAFLDPFDWTGQDEKYWRKKSFLEVGGYLLTAHGFEGEPPATALQEVVLEGVNDRRYAHQLARSPQKVHHFAAPILYAKARDGLAPETERAFLDTLALGAFRECEWPAYRWLEFWYLSRLVSRLFDRPDVAEAAHDLEAVLPFSQFHQQPHPIRADLPQTYCLTHDVMFYNNVYGICGDVLPDGPAPYDISGVLPGLILRFMAEGNCDIVLELVASGVLQRQISRDLVRFVLSWILEKVDGRGYVPGPELTKSMVMDAMSTVESEVVSEGQRWDYASDRERRWGENYHTTLVAGFTARILAQEYDHLEARADGVEFADPTVRRDLGRLGEVLQSLAGYDLEAGARRLAALAESPVLEAYPDLTGQIREFIERQRTDDGQFGYWTQERILYTNAGHSATEFEETLVEPIGEACRAALSAVDSRETRETGETREATHSTGDR